MDIVRKLLLVIFFIFHVLSSFAQESDNIGGLISGRVIDSASRSPLEYATITLTKTGDTKPLNGTTTDPAGHFTVKEIQPGSYSILVEFIGFRSKTIDHIPSRKRMSSSI